MTRYKVIHKHMLWYWIAGRRLDVMDSGQKTECYEFDQNFNMEMLCNFEVLDEC